MDLYYFTGNGEWFGQMIRDLGEAHLRNSDKKIWTEVCGYTSLNGHS
jgi:hypothetical protein